MNDDIAVKVDGVAKEFKLPHEKTTSIKSAVVNFYKRNRSFERQKVLNDISFEVKKGEFFGIVGRNGSGKSTLLKMLAGIYIPNAGTVQIKGLLTPFIELGVGFNPELTGRENVFLNGALLGFSRKEMNAMYDDIVEFAEIEKFMDQKLKNYSSGMQVRLAFSIAIRAKSDILLIDEVLAVGDTAFQRKCYEVFTALRKEGRTIIFITHDMSAVERFCDRVMVIDKGKSKGIFTPSDATIEYDKLNARYEKAPDASIKKQKNRWGTGEVKVTDVTFYRNGKALKEVLFETGEKFEVEVKTKSKNETNIVVGIAFEDVFGVNISGPNTIGQKISAPGTVRYTIDKLPLLPGSYKMTIAIFSDDLNNEYDHLEKLYSFEVVAKEHNLYGKVNLFGSWHEK